MSLQSFDLTGRVALVTGASSGLGVRFAHVLAEAGAKVVLAARRVALLEQVQADIIAKGGAAISVPMDSSDEASTIAAYNLAEKAFGTVDTIVANAGINTEGMALDVSVEEFDRVFAVNVRGAFLTAREGARRMIAANMRERERGRIVLISSVTANVVDTGIAPYAASKAAVQHLGKYLAREWMRKGINVNCICPGYINTDMNGDWFESEGGQKQIAGWPRRRLMQPEDLDGALLYLSSDASRAVTGISITVDDGQRI